MPDALEVPPIDALAQASNDELMAELRQVALYRQHPESLAERHGFLSGALFARGIDPDNYEPEGTEPRLPVPEGDHDE